MTIPPAHQTHPASLLRMASMLWLESTREAPTVSPKSLLISGAENEPSGHGKVLLLK